MGLNMSYSFQSRLRHASNRFSEVNWECATYVTVDGSEFGIHVSPILISADELSPGDASLLRVERQDFVVWRCDRGPKGAKGLGSHYPPSLGDKIRRADGDEFELTSMGRDEPPYTHVTSERNRVILHTVRTKTL